MNSSKGDRATGVPETPEAAYSLKTVHKMLPLVGRIVDDILNRQHALERLEPEQARLDRQRRDLSWPERQRRYQVQEELAQAERALNEVRDELAGLHVVLLLGDAAAEADVLARAARRSLRVEGLGPTWMRDTGVPRPGGVIVGYAAPPEHAFGPALRVLTEVLGGRPADIPW